MATLREALGQASSFVTEKVTASAVTRLREESKKVAREVQEFYEEFFTFLADEVLDTGLEGTSPGLPPFFSSVSASPWKPLSDSWMKQKDRFSTGDIQVLNFYHGITTSLSSRMTQKHKKGRFRKGGTPFRLYIASLAADPTMTTTLFGAVEITYSLTRPDGGKTQVNQVGDIVEKVMQWNDRKRFASTLDGTVLTASIKAFPRLDRVGSSEEAVIKFLSQRDPANKNQWLKVSHGPSGSWKIRPIITPLIQWYLQIGFKQILEGRFK